MKKKCSQRVCLNKHSLPVTSLLTVQSQIRSGEKPTSGGRKCIFDTTAPGTVRLRRDIKVKETSSSIVETLLQAAVQAGWNSTRLKNKFSVTEKEKNQLGRDIWENVTGRTTRTGFGTNEARPWRICRFTLWILKWNTYFKNPFQKVSKSRSSMCHSAILTSKTRIRMWNSKALPELHRRQTISSAGLHKITACLGKLRQTNAKKDQKYSRHGY